jgi:CheY-like chemotaxis protein
MRVVLADDSMLLREGLARLLEEAEFEVVAQSGTAEDLLRHVAMHKPDVAIVDIRMPPSHTDEGLRAAQTIREKHPHVGVLVLSARGQRRGRRLSAEGSRLGPRGVRSRATARRRGRLGTRSDGRLGARRSASARGSARGADAARARSAGADGGGPIERCYRGRDVRDRAGGREARNEHLPEVAPARKRREPPARAGRAPVPALARLSHSGAGRRRV